ncbi:MAG: DUF697 domain-containing protein [Coriobacteriia bacterium]|nr:DUF697 domain-containing protein [Coriobacteriia bacterium]
MASFNIGDLKKVFSAGSDANKARNTEIRLAIFIEENAPQALIDFAYEYLNPQLPSGLLHVSKFSDASQVEIHAATNLALILAAADVQSLLLLDQLSRHKIPARILTSDKVLLSHVSLEGSQGLNYQSILELNETKASRDAALSELARWILSLGDEVKDLAFAANFPFVRRQLAEKIVQDTSKQNALVGGVAFIPGADMPIMTANQAKMILQIAAAYGQEIGTERIKEIAAIVGGGFAMRALARNVVGIVPALGWAVKAGIGYSGTLAMGKAVIEYFESGGNISGIADKLKEVGGSVSESIQDKLSQTENIKKRSLPFFKNREAKDKDQAPAIEVDFEIIKRD